MASFTPAGSGGIPVTANIPGVTQPTIANVTATLANTEYSYTFPVNTKRFRIKLRDTGAKLKVAYIATTSGTTYETLNSGAYLEEGDIEVISITIYFQATQPAQIVEITSWV